MVCFVGWETMRPDDPAPAVFNPWEDPMIRRSKPLLTAGLLLVVLVAGQQARAEDDCGSGCGSGGDCGSCCGKSGMGGLFAHDEPSVTWYAPYPYWWPQYFGPPHSDYAPVQYVTPPAETALMVKERIAAINAGNPALLPPAKEPMPSPKSDAKKPATKLP
jgi:hypothetical protein